MSLRSSLFLLFFVVSCAQKIYYSGQDAVYSADFGAPASAPGKILSFEGMFSNFMVTGSNCGDKIYVAEKTQPSLTMIQYDKNDQEQTSMGYSFDKAHVASGCTYSTAAYAPSPFPVVWMAYTYTYTFNKTEQVWVSIASYEPSSSAIIERANMQIATFEVARADAPSPNSTQCAQYEGSMTLDLLWNPNDRSLHAIFADSWLTFNIDGLDLSLANRYFLNNLTNNNVIDSKNNRIIGFYFDNIYSFDIASKTMKWLRSSPVNRGSTLTGRAYDPASNALIVSDLQDGILAIQLDSTTSMVITSEVAKTITSLAVVTSFSCYDVGHGKLAIIIGCSVGGVAVLATIIAVILWRRRRHHHYHAIVNHEPHHH